MALTRKFRGKLYYFDAQYHNEHRAYSRSASLRASGNLAKVKRVDALTWEVWVREKNTKKGGKR